MTRNESAARAERHARGSSLLEGTVRAGLVAYGVVHLLLAWVAVSLVVQRATGGGGSQGSSTGQGALAQLAGDALGRLLLGAMALLFAGLVLWQLVAAVVGHRDESGWRRLARRIVAGGRCLVYGYFAVSCARLAVQGPPASGKSPKSTTARLLDAPFGPFLVVAAGAVVAGIGIGLVVHGWRRGFVGLLDEQARRGGRRTTVVVLGQAGYTAKGLAFVVVGVLLTIAAVTHDPRRAGGLDQALFVLLGHTVGSVAIVGVGLGLGCFGLYLAAMSRHLDDDQLTSA